MKPAITGRGWIIAAFFLPLCLAGCRQQPEQPAAVETPILSAPSATPSPAREKAAANGPVDFTLPDLRGKPVSVKTWRGHPVIIDFWATWCPPCRKQIPELNDIYKRYRKKGLVVLGVSCDTIKGDGVKAVVPFLQQFKVSYPILMGNDATVDALELSVVPTTLFVARDGRVVAKMEGAGREGELSEATENLLRR